MNIRISFFALLLLLLPVALPAQVGGDKCGSWEGADIRLDELAAYFVAAEHAEFREGMIEQVSADAPRIVVTNRQECTKVVNAALKVLRSADGWREMHRLGFQHNVFRYGPYYAVVVLQNVPEGEVRVGGYAIMLIFRADDLEYLGAGLV